MSILLGWTYFFAMNFFFRMYLPLALMVHNGLLTVVHIFSAYSSIIHGHDEFYSSFISMENSML